MAAHSLSVTFANGVLEIADANKGVIQRITYPTGPTGMTEFVERRFQFATVTDSDPGIPGFTNVKALIVECDGDLTLNLDGASGTDIPINPMAIFLFADTSGIASANFLVTTGSTVNATFWVLGS